MPTDLNSTHPLEQEIRRKVIRLMLIEDSDADALLVAEAARELSFDLQAQRLVTVGQVNEVLEKGIQEPLDGVLLDLNLPGGSGLDVLRKIRNGESTHDLAVVVMTTSISERDREAATRLGVAGYLVKPNEYSQYVATVGIALQLILDANRE